MTVETLPQTVPVGTMRDLSLALEVDPETLADVLYARWGVDIKAWHWALVQRPDRYATTVEPVAKIEMADTQLERFFIETVVAQWFGAPRPEVVQPPAPAPPAPSVIPPTTLIEGEVVPPKPDRPGGLKGALLGNRKSR
jgi:hypothetical protein